jgi:hypothetical protein
MFTHEGIGVGAWVNLTPSCPVEPDVSGDELHIEFGSRPTSLTLVIQEEMVDQLVSILTDAQARFQELDAEASE